MGSYLHTYHKGHKLYYAGTFGGCVNLQPKEHAILYIREDAAEKVAAKLAIYMGRHDFQVEAANERHS